MKDPASEMNDPLFCSPGVLTGHVASFFSEETLCCCFKQYKNTLRGQWENLLVRKQFIILNGISREIIDLFSDFS